MQESTGEHGRAAQRRRTRKAIIQAAMELIARGETLSTAAVAQAADVSKRTIYLYFPTLDQLLIDATLGALTQATVDSIFAPSERDCDVEARVEALARALVRQRDPQQERLGRTLIRLTVEDRGDHRASVAPRRGYRRVDWIEQALAPLRARLDEPRFERLVSALAMVLGWEAMLVLRDIRGLDPAEEEDVCSWAARALVKATLDELNAEARDTDSTATDDVFPGSQR